MVRRHPLGGLFGLTCIVVVGSASCVVDAEVGDASPGAEVVEAAAPRPSERAMMPPGLRAAYIAAVQAGASEAYRAQQGGAAVSVQNPAQRFGAELTASGVTIAPSKGRGDWRWSVATVGYGCDGALDPVQVAAPAIADGRIEYRRGDLVEWYVNGPLGLEQGFTLASAPACRTAGGGPVTLALEAQSSLEAALTEGGDAVEWRDADGRAVVRYTDLHVVDAEGKVLPARLAVNAGQVSLQVDDTGAVYPVVVDPLVWTEEDKLLAGDGAANNSFGRTVAISGDTAVVGAPNATTMVSGVLRNNGGAYVFVRSGSTWTQQARLSCPDSGIGDGCGLLGYSVAISGNTIAAGAPGKHGTGGSTPVGAVYVFVGSGSSWTLEQKLYASDGASYDYFGQSVALDGDTLVASGQLHNHSASNDGAAYVFTRSGSTWTEQQELVPDDAAESDEFGWSVAISGDSIVVGSRLDDTPATNAGSAYVFVRSGSSWTQQAKLVEWGTGSGLYFGWSVAISGDTVLVGAYNYWNPWNTSGAAYVFVRSGSSWTGQQVLSPIDSAAFDNFGMSVAIQGDRAVIGAVGGDTPSVSGTGTAYVFERSGTTWTQQQEIFASDGAGSDSFGSAIALDGDTVVVGAPGDDDLGSGSGSAYVFVLEDI
ncbi:FG-GAP repeat protein [Sorangium sp. So ce176]|uniref:FG-GAP repeat protein n=1 Tax=Sorangium sp. So ce176 TaxID=3133286 RepID=UPI003F6292BD